VDAWLTKQADALAARGPVDRTRLELSDGDVEALLEIARIAAHESGDRRNAPLLCYLVGVASAGGAGVDELAGIVRRSTS
jgi:hypothetical protein